MSTGRPLQGRVRRAWTVSRHGAGGGGFAFDGDSCVETRDRTGELAAMVGVDGFPAVESLPGRRCQRRIGGELRADCVGVERAHARLDGHGGRLCGLRRDRTTADGRQLNGGGIVNKFHPTGGSPSTTSRGLPGSEGTHVPAGGTPLPHPSSACRPSGPTEKSAERAERQRHHRRHRIADGPERVSDRLEHRPHPHPADPIDPAPCRMGPATPVRLPGTADGKRSGGSPLGAPAWGARAASAGGTRVRRAVRGSAGRGWFGERRSVRPVACRVLCGRCPRWCSRRQGCRSRT